MIWIDVCDDRTPVVSILQTSINLSLGVAYISPLGVSTVIIIICNTVIIITIIIIMITVIIIVILKLEMPGPGVSSCFSCSSLSHHFSLYVWSSWFFRLRWDEKEKKYRYC